MFPPKPSDTLPLEVDAQRRCVQSKPSDTLPLEADARRRCVQNTTHTCVPCEHFFPSVVQEAAPAYQTSPRAFVNNAGRLCDSPDQPCALPNLNALYR